MMRSTPTLSPGSLIGRLRLRQMRRDGLARAGAAGVALPPAPARGYSRRAFMAGVRHEEQLEQAIFQATFMLAMAKKVPEVLTAEQINAARQRRLAAQLDRLERHKALGGASNAAFQAQPPAAVIAAPSTPEPEPDRLLP